MSECPTLSECPTFSFHFLSFPFISFHFLSAICFSLRRAWPGADRSVPESRPRLSARVGLAQACVLIRRSTSHHAPSHHSPSFRPVPVLRENPRGLRSQGPFVEKRAHSADHAQARFDAADRGYRRTPVMQIGADVFCDTQIIIREIERRFPSPTLFPPGAAGAPWALGSWTDRAFFQNAVSLVFRDSRPQGPPSVC